MNVAGIVLRRILQADLTECNFPGTPYISCSVAQGFSRLLQGQNLMLTEETALATEKIRRVHCDVFPAVCAETNRAASPDPTPVGYISSTV